MLSWNHLGLAYYVSISSTIREQIIQLVFACALRFTLRWVSKNVSKFTIRYIFFRSEIGSIQTCVQSAISIACSLFCCDDDDDDDNDNDDDEDDDDDVLSMMS